MPFGAVLTYWFQTDRPIDAVHSVGGLAAAGERTSDEKFPDTEHHSGSSVQIGKRRILIGDYRLWSAQDSIETHVGEYPGENMAWILTATPAVFRNRPCVVASSNPRPS